MKEWMSLIWKFISGKRKEFTWAMLVSLGLVGFGFTYPEAIRSLTLVQKNMKTGFEHAEIQRQKESLTMEIQALDKKLSGMVPKSYYLVINTSSNEFSLFKNADLVRKDQCSTGSYILLKKGDSQEWMFKTPKGEFKIRNKNTAPVWKKPDWAFVEEGLPVPSPNHSSRFEYGVLGDYSLSLGHGYLIHGTLYQRFLGLPVTHGCVRLNDESLELIYKTMPIGAKVFIF